MHELSVATALYRACRAEMETRAGGRLREVTIAVGELSGVEPDLLRFAWEAVTIGGRDNGASLDIQWCAARQTCPDCGPVPERQPGTWLRLCPNCDLPLRIEGGEELDITRIGFDAAHELQETSP